MTDDPVAYIAIAQLQRRYADISTRRAWSEVVAIATPDCRFSFDTRHGLYEIEGAAAFAESGAQLADRFTFSDFIPVNFVVTFGVDGTADGRSYCLEVAQERETGEWIEHYGLYEDEYALFEGTWRFSRRHYRTLARRTAAGPAEIFPLAAPI
ncbi:MAG: nuclear transport factor 2 family protein [Acidimicrobiales bacterium]